MSLLKTTDFEVSDIGDFVGYPGDSGFTVAFTRWSSKNPTNLREESRR